MPPKKNPLNLNPLQLKTLTLFQVLAGIEDVAKPAENGEIEVTQLPHAHGDHFHLGAYVVMSKDATGLNNPAVWAVLERKGMIRSNIPHSVFITKDGLAYDAGMQEILHGSNH